MLKSPLENGRMICACGRQAYRMSWSSDYHWDMWEVRWPPNQFRAFRCPPCARAMERQSIRDGFGANVPTALDIWDDASNDPSESRRLDEIEAKRRGK